MAMPIHIEFIQDIEDLNKEVGKNVYILIVDDIMLASTRKSDINEALAEEKHLVSELMSKDRKTISEINLIYGLLLDPLELPLELPQNLAEEYDIWVLKKDHSINLAGSIEYEVCDNIEEATCVIETCMEKQSTLEIEDFAVLMATEVDLILQVESDIKIINTRCLE